MEFWNDNDGWGSLADEIGFDFDDYGYTKTETIAQSLSSPLLALPLIKLRKVLGLIEDDEYSKHISSYSNLRKEKYFVDFVFEKSKEWYKTIPSPDTYTPEFLVEFLQMCRTTDPETPSSYLEFPISRNIDSIVSQAMKGAGFPDNFSIFPPSFPDCIFRDSHTKNLVMWMKLFEFVSDRRRGHSQIGVTEPVSANIRNQVWFTDVNFFAVVFKGANPKVIFGSYNMFLCIVDTIRVRATALLASHILELGQSLRDSMTSQYKWQEDCILRYGNLGYELAKATEAVWKCAISRLSDGPQDYADSLTRMYQKLEEKERKLIEEILLENPTSDLQAERLHTPLVDRLKTLVSSVPLISHCLELFGITKSIGHPLIYPEVGGKSARELAQADDYSYLHAIDECYWVFCHLILKNYIAKYGKWPPLVSSGLRLPTKKPRLQLLSEIGARHIHDSSYPLTDWMYFRIGKIFEFDYHKDYTQLLKDKACAPLRSQVEKFYKGRNVDRSTRRILNVMISEQITDTQDLIDRFSKDILSAEEYNIFLFPKECEFKVAARMFCMLTFHMRLILSIMQENVKECVFKLLPYQSMTMTNQQLHSSLTKMTTVDSDSETVFVEVDLSRWNLNFRNLLMMGFGEMFDIMFGVDNYFCRAHEVFDRSLVTVFVPDQRIPQYEPGWDKTVTDSDLQWTGHQGGFEGIDQASWTVATICFIQRALLKMPCRFKMLGQGDNQTLAITRNPGNATPFHEFITVILERIEQSCAEVNQIAKPDEFVDSLSVLSYSKNFYINGTLCPMELKYASKIGPLTSTDLPSFADSLSATFSAAIGSAQNSNQPIRHYGLALLTCEILLARVRVNGAWMGDAGKEITELLDRDSSLPLLLLTIPSAIGGAPISTITSFICANEPDPLSAELALLKRMSVVSPAHARYLGYLLSDKPYHEIIKSLDKLVADPFSLPFKQPPTQRSVLDKASLQNLKYKTKNLDIKDALKFSSGVREEALIKSISSMNPFYPCLAHDMYKLSVLGKIDQLKKMFTLTRTFMSSVSGSTISTSRLLSMDINYTTTIIARLIESTSAPLRYGSEMTSFDLAQLLRSKWRLPASMEGVSTSHPLDYNFSLEPCESHGIQVFREQPKLLKIDEKIFMNGPAREYKGSKTYEKRVRKDYEIILTSSILELKKLVLLSTAVGLNDDGSLLMNYLVGSRSNYTLDQLIEYFPHTIGGIADHRYEMFSDSGAIGPVGNQTHTTYMTICTDNIPGLSGGKDDYPVAFQQYFSYCAAFNRLISNNKSNAPYFCLTLNVERLPKLIKKDLMFSLYPHIEEIVNLSRNRLLYVGELLVRNKKEIAPVNAKRSIKKIPLNKLMGPTSSIVEMRLAVSSLILNKLDELLRDTDFETSTLMSSTTSSLFDVASLSAINPIAFWECCVQAGIWWMNRLSVINYGNPHGQKMESVDQLDMCSRIVSMFFSTSLKIDSYSFYFKTIKCINLGPSSSGLAHLHQTLITKLDTEISNLRLASDPHLTNFLAPATFLKGQGLSLIRTSHFASCNLFVYITRKLGKKNLSLRAKHYLTEVLYLLKNLSNSEVDPEVFVYDLAEKINSALVASGQPISDSFRSFMIDMSLKPIPAFDSSPEEVHRLLRQYSTYTTKEQFDEFKIKVQTPTKTVLFDRRLPKAKMCPISRGLPLSYPRDLQPTTHNRYLSYYRHVNSRLDVPHGVYTSVARLWSPILTIIENHETAVVWGFGAGGLMDLLNQFGINTIGMDLQTVIPREMRGNYLYSPPEVLDSVNSKVSLLTHTTSGDIMDLEVIETVIRHHNPDSIVIDIEAGKKRFGFELVEQFLHARYRKRIFIKFFLNKEETDWMLSAISSVANSIFVSAPFGLDVQETRPVVFSFVLNIFSTPLATITHKLSWVNTNATSTVTNIRDDSRAIIGRLVSEIGIDPNVIRTADDLIDELFNMITHPQSNDYETRRQLKIKHLLAGISILKDVPAGTDPAEFISKQALLDEICFEGETKLHRVKINNEFRQLLLKVLPKLYSWFTQ